MLSRVSNLELKGALSRILGNFIKGQVSSHQLKTKDYLKA